MMILAVEPTTLADIYGGLKLIFLALCVIIGLLLVSLRREP